MYKANNRLLPESIQKLLSRREGIFPHGNKQGTKYRYFSGCIKVRNSSIVTLNLNLNIVHSLYVMLLVCWFKLR